MEDPVGEFVQTVAAGAGMIFLSHTEERPDHPVEHLTGVEIYNRHWDAKKEPLVLMGVAAMLTDPKALAELTESVRLYPDEVLAFQCDYPSVYLDKWDEGNRTHHLTGVAANDCHHNQVLIAKMADAETVWIGTQVDRDDQLRKVSAAARPGIRELTRGHKPGDIVARVDLDPYYRSFRNSCTHILAKHLDEASIRSALKAGHAYVAHEWMAEATGFRFTARAGKGAAAGASSVDVAIMGDEIRWREGLVLEARLPQTAYLRLLKDGAEVAQMDGAKELSFAVREPAAYRLEAWLRLDGELRPWLFSNPIYVRGAGVERGIYPASPREGLRGLQHAERLRTTGSDAD